MQRNHLKLASLVGGKPVDDDALLTIRNPYNRAEVGTVRLSSRDDAARAVALAVSFSETPGRHQRAEILEAARGLLRLRREEFAQLITSESGLALREARYEVGRTLDVLRFSAMEALRDDGQIFSADSSSQGNGRKIFTTRE